MIEQQTVKVRRLNLDRICPSLPARVSATADIPPSSILIARSARSGVRDHWRIFHDPGGSASSQAGAREPRYAIRHKKLKYQGENPCPKLQNVTAVKELKANAHMTTKRQEMSDLEDRGVLRQLSDAHRLRHVTDGGDVEWFAPREFGHGSYLAGVLKRLILRGHVECRPRKMQRSYRGVHGFTGRIHKEYRITAAGFDFLGDHNQ